MKLENVETPAFLVNKSVVEANCSRMIDICKKYGIQLRCHVKTHKTIEGGILQTGGTRRCIVTSTLNEAEFYADNGFDDILFGIVFGPQHLDRCHQLCCRLSEFHIMLDSIDAVSILKDNLPPRGKQWSVVLSVDTGSQREGVWWEDKMVEEIASAAHSCAHINFTGIYIYCGNSYNDRNLVEQVRDSTIERAIKVVGRLKARGISCSSIGTGSTPSCSKPASTFSQVTEIHPGNYVFYDVEQMQLGSCKVEDIACCVATRIIGHYPRRKQMLVDCGFTALTMQGWGKMESGYGVFKNEPNLKLCAMNQEIGYVETLNGDLEFNKYPVGKLLFIYPYHSCATAAMYSMYHVFDGDEIIETWKPTKGWSTPNQQKTA